MSPAAGGTPRRPAHTAEEARAGSSASADAELSAQQPPETGSVPEVQRLSAVESVSEAQRPGTESGAKLRPLSEGTSAPEGQRLSESESESEVRCLPEGESVPEMRRLPGGECTSEMRRPGADSVPEVQRLSDEQSASEVRHLSVGKSASEVRRLPKGVTASSDRRRLPETESALAVRHAVRGWLAEHAAGETRVAVALSGGADSLALTAAAVVEAESVHALVVDHQLQAGSANVAAQAAAAALALGCRSARVLAVEVGRDGGMEAAARQARYAALDAARDGLPVLLGHTLDDQAETVLLGLARGSGGRSIQGMAAFAEPWGRPLLGVRRAVTRQLCLDLGLSPHEDPHNSAAEFTRVRLRTEVLPLLEEVLGGGVAGALARTAAQLREDGAVLDVLAGELLGGASVDADSDDSTLSIETLATVPAALRKRAVRSWLLARGAKALTNRHLQAIDELVTDWRGQGGVAVGGAAPGSRLVVAREHGRLTLRLRAV